MRGGGSVVPKRRRPPRPCGSGLSGPKAEEAPWPMQRGPRWSQNGGDSLAHAAGSSVVPKGRRFPRPCGGGLSSPKTEEAPPPMRRGP